MIKRGEYGSLNPNATQLNSPFSPSNSPLSQEGGVGGDMPQERSMYKKVLDRCISLAINNMLGPIFQKEGIVFSSF